EIRQRTGGDPSRGSMAWSRSLRASMELVLWRRNGGPHIRVWRGAAAGLLYRRLRQKFLSLKNLRRRTCAHQILLLHAAPPTQVGLPRCGRGGIGRRAALRSLWGNPWKFEASRTH